MAIVLSKQNIAGLNFDLVKEVREIARHEKLDVPSPSLSNMNSDVLDGLGNKKALLTVLNRNCLASLVYGAASTLFIFALLTAFDVHAYGWGPLQMAAANLVFVVYFTTIMLPFSMLLAWTYRFKQYLPYQWNTVDVSLNKHQAFELALGAVLSIRGSRLLSADERTGEIRCSAPRTHEAKEQEIRVQINSSSDGSSRLLISSQPLLNAIEYLLFGFTLSVDGGRNKANVDEIVTFLSVGAEPSLPYEAMETQGQTLDTSIFNGELQMPSSSMPF